MAIIQTCRRLGMGPGGFYTPEYANGSRMKLRMMCLGRDWDPQARRYQEVRKDGAKTPSIPLEFHALVQAAVGAAQSLESDPVPSLTPDLCIVNFYESGGRLGLHQDKDESIETINEGRPVVSISIGDDAEFLFGDQKRMDKAQKLWLKSGDVLVFGGPSRLLYHGIRKIKLNSALSTVVNPTHLRPGRLNLTFRKF